VRFLQLKIFILLLLLLLILLLLLLLEKCYIKCGMRRFRACKGSTVQEQMLCTVHAEPHESIREFQECAC
jgi:hypothetical protein